MKMTIRQADTEKTIVVKALSIQRGPALAAALLYEKTSESQQKRELLAEQHKFIHSHTPSRLSVSIKKQRRLLMKLKY